MEATIDRLTEVFRRVFEDDALTLTRSTSAKDVEGWDSVRHVTLMLNVERAFKIKLSSREIASLKNVGELLDLLEKKLAK